MIGTEVIGIQEFSDTAIGARALDAAVKVAPVTLLMARVINPGKLFYVLTGDVASVELSLRAGQRAAGSGIVDELFLPFAEPGVVAALSRDGTVGEWDAMGILDTATIAAGVAAADQAAKRAEVRVAEIRFDDAMGGRASVRLIGTVGEVEAGLEAGAASAESRGSLIRSVLLPNPHDDLRSLLMTKDGNA